LWGTLSDKRTGLSFVYAAGPSQCSLSRVRVPWDSRLYFTVSDLRLETSVFVASYDPHGHGGRLRPLLHMGLTQSKSELTTSTHRPGTDRTVNISYIIACSLNAREAMYPQSCSLAVAVVLSHVYTAVTWQWVCLHVTVFEIPVASVGYLV
jgi:hypothetical protein